MFIGHWSAAFAAGAASDRAPKLGTLFIAAQLVDWAFFTLVLLGVEDMRVQPGITRLSPLDLYHMPITHSLLGAAGFALAYGLLVGVGLRDRVAGFITAAVVLSHWLLDLLVGAFVWYLRRTDGPALGPIVLAVLLLAMQAFNWFGPPPVAGAPVAPMALLALAAYALATLVAWWVGTTRRTRGSAD